MCLFCGVPRITDWTETLLEAAQMVELQVRHQTMRNTYLVLLAYTAAEGLEYYEYCEYYEYYYRSECSMHGGTALPCNVTLLRG